jgi:hypothetical protein
MALIRFLLLCFAAAALSGCSKKTLSQKPEAESRYEGYQKATVKNFKGRDGCDFALQLETGENLEPGNLPEEFQKDDLPVWVRYSVRKNMASICMIGKMVTVTDIKKR